MGCRNRGREREKGSEGERGVGLRISAAGIAAVLRLFQGSIKALSRLFQGSMKALSGLFQGSIKAEY